MRAKRADISNEDTVSRLGAIVNSVTLGQGLARTPAGGRRWDRRYGSQSCRSGGPGTGCLPTPPASRGQAWVVWPVERPPGHCPRRPGRPAGCGRLSVGGYHWGCRPGWAPGGPGGQGSSGTEGGQGGWSSCEGPYECEYWWQAQSGGRGGRGGDGGAGSPGGGGPSIPLVAAGSRPRLGAVTLVRGSGGQGGERGGQRAPDGDCLDTKVVALPGAEQSPASEG